MNKGKAFFGIAALAVLAGLLLRRKEEGLHKFNVGDVIQLGGDPKNSRQKITKYTSGPAPSYGKYTVLVLDGWAQGQTLEIDCVIADRDYKKVA